MRKSFYLLFFSLFLYLGYSQVGINEQDPEATLDVVGSPNNSGIVDGIIPPRITGDQLQSKTVYGAKQDGAVVYVT